MGAWSDISNWLYIPVVAVAGWGIRHYLLKKNRYTPLHRSTLVVGLLAWFLTETGRSFYRPFVYARQIDDWHVADTIGNTFGTMTAIFIVLTMAGRGTRADFKLIAGIAAGLLVFELLSPSLGGSTDPWDIGATVLSGGVSALIFWRLLGSHHPTRNGLPQQNGNAEPK